MFIWINFRCLYIFEFIRCIFIHINGHMHPSEWKRNVTTSVIIHVTHILSQIKIYEWTITSTKCTKYLNDHISESALNVAFACKGMHIHKMFSWHFFHSNLLLKIQCSMFPQYASVAFIFVHMIFRVRVVLSSIPDLLLVVSKIFHKSQITIRSISEF